MGKATQFVLVVTSVLIGSICHFVIAVGNVCLGSDTPMLPFDGQEENKEPAAAECSGWFA